MNGIKEQMCSKQRDGKSQKEPKRYARDQNIARVMKNVFRRINITYGHTWKEFELEDI